MVWVLFQTLLRYTDKLAFVLMECTKTTWLRDDDLKIIKRSLPFEEYMAVHTVVCSAVWIHFVLASD